MAVGAFQTVGGVTTESDSLAGANGFSLQVNSDFFITPFCSGAANPPFCRGWEQFVFSSTSSTIFIQNWMTNYGQTTCPDGWSLFTPPKCTTAACNDCVLINNGPATSVPAQVIGNLAQLSLAGRAASGGVDSVIFTSTGGPLYAMGKDSVLTLAPVWQRAEFNVFGAGGASTANFNTGSTLVVTTSIDDGTSNPATCGSRGFTGESNNLSLIPPMLQRSEHDAADDYLHREQRHRRNVDVPSSADVPRLNGLRGDRDRHLQRAGCGRRLQRKLRKRRRRADAVHRGVHRRIHGVCRRQPALDRIDDLPQSS